MLWKNAHVREHCSFEDNVPLIGMQVVSKSRKKMARIDQVHIRASRTKKKSL